MELFLHQVLAGLATGGIYACMALAVVMIYQAIDHLNFAQGEMAMFSTFIAWQLIQWGIPYWLAFGATIIISFAAGLLIERIVLKPNFVTPGLEAPTATAGTVAAATFDVLSDAVPEDVAGIAFLSGGHPTTDVVTFLRELHRLGDRPWPVTFSFGRALVSDALSTWSGDAQNVAKAQQVLVDNCRRAGQATH